MAQLEVHQFSARGDNFGVLIHDPETGATASIDAPDAETILAALHEKGWELSTSSSPITITTTPPATKC